MKRIMILALAILMTFSFFSCAETNSINSLDSNANRNAEESSDISGENVVEREETLRIVATNFPAYNFAKEVVGDYAYVKMLLPPGVEMHSYEPTPKDIIDIENCDIFIYNGGVSDSWVDTILASIDDKNIEKIKMMDEVEVVEEEIVEGMQEEKDSHNEENNDDKKDDSKSDEHEDVEYDEHIWTSPKNVIKIVEAISKVAKEKDEEMAELYRSNTSIFVSELNDLDEEFRDIVESSKRDVLVFGDRFPFRYFVDEYGLDYFAAFPGCSSETEPSVHTVAFLIDKIKEEDIPVVFNIEFSNEKMADAISEATGAKKLTFHSCHNVTKEEMNNGTSYVLLMRQNAQNLKEALN